MECLYKVNAEIPVSLSEKDKVIVYSITARSLVLAKRDRPDVQTGVSFYCTSEKKSD